MKNQDIKRQFFQNLDNFHEKIYTIYTILAIVTKIAIL